MNKRQKRLYEVKRTLRQTKTGVRAYYFQNGKRIPDAKGRQKWIKQNFDAINKPYSKKPVQLTPDEQRSFNNSRAQRGLFTYKGRKIPRLITEILKLWGDISDKSPREITKILNPDGTPMFRNFGEFEQLYQYRKDLLLSNTPFVESKLGAKGHRGRTEHESIFSVMEHLNALGTEKWKLLVIKTNGVAVGGKKRGMEAIQQWELEQMMEFEDEEDVAMLRFRYALNYDFNTKTIIIDLNEAKVDPPFRSP